MITKCISERLTAVLSFVALFCVGQVAMGQDDDSGSTVITVTPCRIDEPFLRYRIFPDDAQRHESNAAVLIQRLWADNRRAMEVLSTSAARHLEIDLQEFDPNVARREAPLLFLDEMRRAAYCRNADWDYPDDGTEPLDRVRISDVSDANKVLRGLAVHCRADIVEGNIEAAIDKLMIGLGCTVHLQTPPFVVQKLTQNRNYKMFLDRIEELIQHENSPNLYFALTALPDQLIEIECLADWLRRNPWHHIEGFNNLEQERTGQEWQDLRIELEIGRRFDHIVNGVYVDNNAPEMVRERFQTYVESGVANLPRLQPELESRIVSISDDEIAVRYFKAQYEALADYYACIVLMPPEEALPLLTEIADQLEDEEWEEVQQKLPAIVHFYADVWAVRRRVAALRVIEALRDHAARNDEMPASLDEIVFPPIPNDPMTGEPFGYTLNADGIAVLTAAPIVVTNGRREPFALTYELQLTAE